MGAVESPFLEVFKKAVCVSSSGGELMFGLHDLSGLFQP